MPQLNEYPIEELNFLIVELSVANFDMTHSGMTPPEYLTTWISRISEAISDREFTDSQLPFLTPKEIEQDERINNAKFI